MMTGASPVLVPREDPVGKIVFAVVVLVFGLTFFVALMTFLAAIFRGQTDRCRDILRDTPYRALAVGVAGYAVLGLSLIHISEPTRLKTRSRMPSSA